MFWVFSTNWNSMGISYRKKHQAETGLMFFMPQYKAFARFDCQISYRIL